MAGGGSCSTGSQAGMGLNFHIVRSISLFTFSSYGFFKILMNQLYMYCLFVAMQIT